MKKDNALTDNKEDEEIVRVGLEILITNVFFAITILIVGLLMKCFLKVSFLQYRFQRFVNTVEGIMMNQEQNALYFLL